MCSYSYDFGSFYSPLPKRQATDYAQSSPPVSPAIRYPQLPRFVISRRGRAGSSLVLPFREINADGKLSRNQSTTPIMLPKNRNRIGAISSEDSMQDDMQPSVAP